MMEPEAGEWIHVLIVKSTMISCIIGRKSMLISSAMIGESSALISSAMIGI